MSSTQKKGNSTEPTASAAKPLPEGYFWRLCVVLVLLVGGGICLIFFSTVIGSLMSLSGLAFGKISGLNEMVSSDDNDTK
jgi:hypothetical protein